jgi:hypothetical protein
VNSGAAQTNVSSIEGAVGNYYVVIMEPLCLLYSRRQIEYSYAMCFILKSLVNCN